MEPEQQLALFYLPEDTIDGLNEAMRIAGEISRELWLLHVASMDVSEGEEDG